MLEIIVLGVMFVTNLFATDYQECRMAGNSAETCQVLEDASGDE